MCFVLDVNDVVGYLCFCCCDCVNFWRLYSSVLYFHWCDTYHYFLLEQYSNSLNKVIFIYFFSFFSIFAEKDEFFAAMQQVNPDMSDRDIHVLFSTLDLDGNSSISFMEFMAAMVDPREVDIQEMNQVSEIFCVMCCVHVLCCFVVCLYRVVFCMFGYCCIIV